MSVEKFNLYIKIFLITVSLSAIFYLFVKQLAPTDSSISSWMINYQGNFARRGLIGEFLFQIGILLDIHIRFLAFVTQSIFYLSFYYLIYKYYKNLNLGFIFSLALFSPLFLIYPVAELESLGRLEIILLFTFLSFCFLANKSFKIYLLFFYFILPLLMLIWEPSIFYLLFFVVIYILNLEEMNLRKIIQKCAIIVFPTILTLLIISAFKQSPIENKVMCEALIKFYNQKCYMALRAPSQEMITGILEVYHLFSKDGMLIGLINLSRFMLVFIIGYMPLFVVCKFSKFNKKKVNEFIYKNFSVLGLLIFINISTFIIYYLAIDWGRWLHVSYGLSIIFIIYLIKKRIIIYNIKLFNVKSNFFRVTNQKILIIFFILFTLSWNHKTVMHEDIGAASAYKVIQKVYKWRDILLLTPFDFTRSSINYKLKFL